MRGRFITVMAAVLTIAVLAATGRAGEVGFAEDFALSKDRSEALKQLIPDTEDYYYYNCLHLQNTGQLDQVDAMLKVWITRHPRTPRVQEIENRQALLRYNNDNPKATLDYLRKVLGLTFSQQKEILGAKPSLPSVLDANVLSRQKLTAVAMTRNPNTVDGFEIASLDWLISSELTGEQRRSLLGKLTRPDYPNLPQVVFDDLKFKNSGGFGSLAIHGRMLQSQLDELLKLDPTLLNQVNFVNAYIAKLQPNPDLDWTHDIKTKADYYDRLWTFVSQLGSAHNSLKAHVLYHRLVLDRSLGRYNKEQFMTYIKLPRAVAYINPKYLEQQERRSVQADLTADFAGVTLLPPIASDEPLVRSYLAEFFLKEDSYEPYQAFILDTYLKGVFAETKIVNSLGDQEKWYAMLPADRYQALKDRVDIDFAFTNAQQYSPSDEVALDVFIKNVPKLIVQVYRINEANFYRANSREINTDINLDGLVANEKTSYDYTQPPLARHKETFKFQALKDRGTFVVDFIGAGRASRALIRKGHLQFVSRVGAAGQVFTILDEANKKVPDAAIVINGRQFNPDKDGTITVPFTHEPIDQPFAIVLGDFASLGKFQHQGENYSFTCGIHVEREALLKGRKATVVIRPLLAVNGIPVSISLLQSPVLTITTVDREGIPTSKEVPDIKLDDGRDFTYEFQVPENILSISFSIKGKVRNMSLANDEDLAVDRQFDLNGIDITEKVQDLHLIHAGGIYAIDVLGKTGEPKASKPVQLKIKHRDFVNPVETMLATDQAGRITLGKLEGVSLVLATDSDETSQVWLLSDDMHSMPGVVQAQAGQAINIPYMGKETEPTRSALSLLELRGDTFIQDWFAAIKLEGGFIRIQALPAGDYSLMIKETGQEVLLRLGDGDLEAGHVISPSRQLQVIDPLPLQIAGISADADNIRIQLANAAKTTRVHVAATRYMPAYPLFGDMSLAAHDPAATMTDKLTSLFMAGRDLGDEYRYILDRSYLKKYPGNMLDRPSLLLAPWTISKTETLTQAPAPPNAFAPAMLAQQLAKLAQEYGFTTNNLTLPTVGFANLDFLGQPAALLLNLTPDDKGVVTVACKDLGAHQQIHILADDLEATAYREVSLDELQMPTLDLRLGKDAGLDPQQHFTEQKQIDALVKGQSITLADKATSQVESYDSIAKVYALYSTLGKNNATLAEFSFIANWPRLKSDEKLAKYSKYACHELNFFLYKKDPEFFAKVVAPFIANKKDKQFMDLYLLGQDVSAFAQPWSHRQLNAVEQILLAQRIKDEQAITAREIKDQFDLLPVDIERFNYLFKAALKSSDLEVRSSEATAGPVLAGGRGGDNLLLRDANGRRSGAATSPAPVPPAAMALPVDKPAGEAGAAKPAAAPESARRNLARIRPTVNGAADSAAKDAVEKEQLAAVKADLDRRQAGEQFYRKLDKTDEWVENNYYHLPINQTNASLVTANAFWKDYAAYDGKGPFLSVNLAEASHNFTEMMLAMAVLDLPFDAGKADSAGDGAKEVITASEPMVIYHKEIKPASQPSDKAPQTVLVSQNFFRKNDRYQQVDNEKIDKYVTDEFLTDVVYGCQVVVTNPTSGRQKIDVLLQIPVGALPAVNSLYTRGMHLAMEPFSTQQVEYYFYFPFPGQFQHYPVQVARNESLIAFCQPATLNVVETPSKIDRASWDYISQSGSDEDVVQFLKDNNIFRFNLDRIAWRMREKDFFTTVIDLLSRRHVYNHTLWSFGVYHNSPAVINEYLRNCDALVAQCGPYLASALLTIDPVERKTYQHMEYLPLVNARAHNLGKGHSILNDKFSAQYQKLMNILSHRPELDNDDLLGVTYYMLLQDRVEEAIGFFARVDAKKLASQLQYDYFAAYIAFYNEKPQEALAIAKKYQDYPVQRWRNFFANVANQAGEIQGQASPAVVNPDDRTQALTAQAAAQGNFDFKVESRQVTLNYQNLKQVTVHYYPMDIELLFSRNPFVQQYSDQFSFIKPALTANIDLDPKKPAMTFELPKQFHTSNVMIEIDAGSGQKKSQAYFSNALAVQVVENFGQIKVANDKTGQPIAKAYVKVYARMTDGKTQFYKDGYTDLRGRFDYSSLSTESSGSGNAVEKFSILIMTDKDGAAVREANPPKH